MVSNRKQEIDRLVSCFGAGDLAQAEQIARRLLAADRQDEEALHLLAQICYRRGRAEESVTLMKELLGLNPAHAPYNNDYGVMLASLGRWTKRLRRMVWRWCSISGMSMRVSTWRWRFSERNRRTGRGSSLID